MITTRLKKIYFCLLMSAIMGFFIACLIRCLYQPLKLPDHLAAFLSSAIFILAVTVSIAGPILYRTLFAHKHRNFSVLSRKELLRFERNLIVLAMAAPHMAFVAYFLQLHRFLLAGTMLAALYAVYYHYPSNQRIAFDKKLFRLNQSG